jgi:tetratricopeptide (TPR) repeat protein
VAIATVHPTAAQATCAVTARARATDPTWLAQTRMGAPTWFSRAFELHSHGRYVEAIAAFEKAIDRGERQAASTYNVACGYARLGDKDRAFEWLDKALEAGFSMVDLVQHDADLASLRDDPRYPDFDRRLHQQQLTSPAVKASHVVARYEALAARNPPAPEGWFSLGSELARAGEFDRAAQAFREAAARSGKPGGPLYNAACALARGRRTTEALRELRRALEEGFDDPRLLRSDPDLQSVRNEPGFAELTEMADALAFPANARPSRWRDAAERFEGYGKSHPQLGRAFFNAGLARLFAGEPSQASADFTRALDLGYRESVTLYNLACAEARQGHRDRAFALLTQAVEAGFDDSWQLRRDSDLDPLREDPRFRDAIRRAAELQRRRAEG